MGKTAEGQDNGNPSNVFQGVTATSLDAATDMNFGSYGDTTGSLPKSTGLHPAQFALGHGIPD